MGRIPDGQFPKERITLSIDGELFRAFKELSRVPNTSAWVEEQIRQEVLNLSLLYQCKCGVIASVQVWHSWQKKCKECGLSHALHDERKAIKPVLK